MYSSANLLLVFFTLITISLLQVQVSNSSSIVAAGAAAAAAANFTPSNDENVEKYFAECLATTFKLSCITEKASVAVENSMDIDLQLLPGIVLIRNDNNLVNSTARQDNTHGIDRFTSVLSKWFNTHSLTLEVGEEGRRRRRRRFGFLLTALMGAFGLTYSMMLKGIAVIAGKALLASKMALMIMGIIGLKKLFSKDDHQEPQVVQVHAMHDEHDRNINAALYNIRHI